MQRRPCSKCGRNRAEKFYVSPRGRVCSTCRKKRTRGTSKNVRLVETYDITLKEWNAILDLQGGVCAICSGRRSTYDTDHDHQSEKQNGTRASVRGILCRRCNRRLLPGCTDSIDILVRAIAYLEDPPAQVILGQREGTE